MITQTSQLRPTTQSNQNPVTFSTTASKIAPTNNGPAVSQTSENASANTQASQSHFNLNPQVVQSSVSDAHAKAT